MYFHGLVWKLRAIYDAGCFSQRTSRALFRLPLGKYSLPFEFRLSRWATWINATVALHHNVKSSENPNLNVAGERGGRSSIPVDGLHHGISPSTSEVYQDSSLFPATTPPSLLTAASPLHPHRTPPHPFFALSHGKPCRPAEAEVKSWNERSERLSEGCEHLNKYVVRSASFHHRLTSYTQTLQPLCLTLQAPRQCWVRRLRERSPQSRLSTKGSKSPLDVTTSYCSPRRNSSSTGLQ